MSMSKVYPHNIGGTVFAVVSGRGGNCLVLGDENGGTRISGPKPLGGGRTIMEFTTDEEYGPTEVLESENERLRELIADGLYRLRDENAKLRELVSDMWSDCPVDERDCERCKHATVDDSGEYPSYECDFYSRMRELGIEVGK